MIKRSVIMLAVTGMAVLALLAACGGGGTTPTKTPATTSPATTAPKVGSPTAPAVSSPTAAKPASPTSAPAVTGIASPAVTAGASPVAAGDVERGRQAAALCLACHTTDGRPSVGPTWKGLYGSSVKLTDGTTVVADAAYIRESILDPPAKVPEGFQPIMTSFNGILTEQQIQDITAYIESLK